MQAVWICVICYLFLFFPIFINSCFLYSSTANRVYYVIYLYGINLLGGYFTRDKTKIYAHTQNKAKIFDVSEYLTTKKKVAAPKGISLYSIKGALQCGIENENCIYLASGVAVINSMVVPIVKQKYRYLRISNSIGFVEGDECVSAVEITTIVNVLTVALFAIKKILEKVINGKSKQKQR